MTVDYFVPGTVSAATGLLGGLLPAWPEDVARHFVEAYTLPDAIVLDPFAVSDTPIREAAAAGRRIIASNSNPLVVLLLRERLSPPDPAVLRSAVTRLGDDLKRGMPLREHLDRLYRTRCPACHRQSVADYFIWSREPADPRQKWVDCPACGEAGLAAVENEDLVVLDDVEARGLHYWYLLNRVAPPGKTSSDDEARTRAEELLDLYTPRALYAIADLLMRIEAIFEEEDQAHLKAVLLTCLGPASNLYPPRAEHELDGSPGNIGVRHILDQLHPPARFIEHNVWRLFEAALRWATASDSQTSPLSLQTDLRWLSQLPSSSKELVGVHKLGVGAVGHELPPESISLVLTVPPQPNPIFWSLAHVWTGWLFGPDEAARVKSLALQKWPDWAWYQSVMTTALHALRPVFRFDGACALFLPASSPHQASAIVLAALGADYDIESWQHRATGEHQFILAPGPLHAPLSQEPEVLRSRVTAESANAAVDFVRARGEPVQTETLHIAAWHRLMRKGLLENAQASVPISRLLGWLNAAISQGLEVAQTNDLVPVRGEEGRPVGWWLRKVGRSAPDPLSDRVEEAVLVMLRGVDGKNNTPVEEADCVGSIYRRFNGPLTPDTGLVRASLRAYGEETSSGYWRLRPSDRDVAWQDTMNSAIRDLLALGERLGYHARQRRQGFDVVWEEEGHAWATFNLVTTANVVRFLPHSEATLAKPEIRWRNLVIPAARASLWQHKLATQPWLAHMIGAGGWTFIKLELLQTLAASDDLTRHDLKAIVGLVPPIESGKGQLPLF